MNFLNVSRSTEHRNPRGQTSTKQPDITELATLKCRTQEYKHVCKLMWFVLQDSEVNPSTPQHNHREMTFHIRRLQF